MTDNPERRRGVERSEALEALKDHIEAIATMSAAVGEKPDLSSIWGSDDVSRLDDAAMKDLARWAREKGYPAPPPEGKEVGHLTETLRANAESIVRMSEAMGTPPDLSTVWNDPAFLALPPEAREALRSEFGAPAEAPPERAATDTSAPAVSPDRGQRESKEKKERRPVKRKFVGYRIADVDGAPALLEDYDEWDKEQEAYVRKSVGTAIGVPPSVAADPERAAIFSQATSGLREELDERGVKLFFDRPKDDPERIKPKWKYFLDGKAEEDLLSESDIPAEVMELVRNDDRYFRNPEWHKWFGREMQKKRESIIGDVVAERLGLDVTPATERIAERDPEPVRETASPEKPAERQERPKDIDISEGLSLLVEKFAPLYTLPDDAAVLVRHVTQFAGSLFRYRRERSGRAAESLPDAEERDMVRRALLEYFRDKGEVEAAAAVIDAFVAKDAKERERNAADPVADKIREARSERELETIIEQLGRSANMGDQGSREAARRHLMDIEFGRAGAASETRLTGLERTEKEREFFAAHPSLERRNIELLKDGRLIVHVDRRQPTEALRRAMTAVIEDAGSGKGREDAVKETAAYFERLVSGVRDDSEEAVRAFREKIASFDPSSAELTITQLEKLKGMVRSVYGRISAEKRS